VRSAAEQPWQANAAGIAFRVLLGAIMSEQDNHKPAKDADRRLFLEKAGRFAAVTPPAIALMLSATGKARAATTSGVSKPSTTTIPITTSTVTIISDRRLKTGIISVGTHPAGFGLYRFRYLWSDTEHVGVLAQEVLKVLPHAVVRGDDGYLRVNYGALGL
jgi:hypothetical protein